MLKQCIDYKDTLIYYVWQILTQMSVEKLSKYEE